MTLLVFYILLALVVSFLCSVMEAVLLSVTPGYLESEVKQGKPYAKKLANLKADIDRPLSAILTLNTIAHTMGAAGAGAQWKALNGDTGEAIFAGVLTFAILVFSEILPKSIGAKFWRNLAKPVTALLAFLVVVLSIFVKMSALITKMLGGKSVHGVSRDELVAMADISERSGHLEDQEGEILRNLLRFQSSKVDDIMTPRTVVFIQSEAMTVDEFLDIALRTPFSRIPVYGESRDDIDSFVLKSDVMESKIRGEVDKTLADFARPLKVVPGTVSIYRLFQLLIEEAQHIMLVVDEFGGMEGVVTMEDVVETLLGHEIVDEADRTEDMQVLARRLWRKRAQEMGIDLSSGVESRPKEN